MIPVFTPSWVGMVKHHGVVDVINRLIFVSVIMSGRDVEFPVLKKLRAVALSMSMWVHARGYIEGYLTLVILRKVISLIIEKCLKILILQYLVVRRLAHGGCTANFVVLNTCQISTKAIETLLVKESLRHHRMWARPSTVLLYLLINVWVIVRAYAASASS